jgi:hypothetical protein
MAAFQLDKVKASYLATALTPWKMNLYFLRYLPSALFWGIRITEAMQERCTTRLRFRWRNQNPYNSIYFAAQAGAAEMSTGLLAIAALQGKPPVSMLVVGLQAEFMKKARGRTLFTCEDGRGIEEAVEKALATGAGQTFTATSIGRLESGEEVSRTRITWSFKPKA